MAMAMLFTAPPPHPPPLKAAPLSSILLLLFLSLPFSSSIPEQPYSSSHGPSVYIVRLRGHLPLVTHAIDADGKVDLLSCSTCEAYSSFLADLHASILEESLRNIPVAGHTYQKLYSYTTLLNAFAVKLSHSELQVEALASHPLVASVEADVRLHKWTTHTPAFLGLSGGGGAWSARRGSVSDAGKGVLIGILDTGIDPSHPSFSDPLRRSPPKRWRGMCPSSPSFPFHSCNGKIVIARHFSKGIVAANAFNSTHDFDSPLDGDGHGTHTSSIAAGNYGVPVIVGGFNYGLASGMAPRARLAVYKAIYRDGGFLSDVLAAIDQAIQDGVDILSLSLGSTTSASNVPFLNAFDIALLFAVKADVLVVHAAGNNGPLRNTINSFGPWLLSVGASTTDRTYLNPVILGNKQEFIGSGLSAGTPGGRLYPLIYSKDAFFDENTITFDPEYYSYCPDIEAFNKTLVRGKILICNFLQLFTGGADIEITDAISTAKTLGAVGLILISTDTESSQQKPSVLDLLPYSLPATVISDTEASLMILDYYNKNTQRDDDKKVLHFGASAWIKDSRVAIFRSEAPQVALYSSRGPVYANTANSLQSDVLKPDIIAPGSQIWGAWTPIGIDAIGFKGERFAMLSGTSMAAPHIAGIAALLKHKHREWSNAAIRSALSTTASVHDNRGRLIHANQQSGNASVPSIEATPFDYGSGFVNATAAMDPGLIFDVGFQDYVNFLCTVPGVDVNSVEEATGGACKGEPGDRGSDLNIPSITVGNLVAARQVKREVTSVSRRKEMYRVEVHPPSGVQVEVRPSMFTISNGQRRSFVVTLKTVDANQAFTFGWLLWIGNKGHVVKMPLAVSAKFMGA